MIFPLFDSTIILLIPAIILTIYAQVKISSAYGKYSQVRSNSGRTGADIARALLDENGLYDVKVEQVAGHLTDHYDPRTQVVRLSSGVYNSTSIAALAVAAHETGHAVQHADGYVPLKLRSAFVPIASFGSNVGPILIILGLFLTQTSFLLTLGIYLFAFAVLFQIVTLPVEYNASNRALAFLGNSGIIADRDEMHGAQKMLSAAALTYVAAALTAILTLLRFVLIAQSRDD
ncbi:zinc metallopeptidase [Dehalobacter sp. DCM]|uniref:zinc metallopeptidase n=1 Tax=Dehalobacter sp. DCM TaxID=2907827 RepID=UPI0030817FA2|nr:zinc metallopeptidase [Dehalobacter sp. DCM]